MAGRLVLDPLPVATPRVLFDVSRLLRSRLRGFGTGVDRIDLAIGRDLAARFGADCRFVHAGLAGPALVPGEVAAALFEALDRRWRGHGGEGADALAAAGFPAPRLAAVLAGGRARGALGAWARIATPETTYVNASHSGVPLRRRGLRAIDPDGRMRRLAYIHDLIPLEYPEYQRPRTAALFARFLAALTDRPVRFATNSEDTARRLSAHAAACGWTVEAVRPLIPRFAPDPAPPGAAPRRTRLDALLQDGRPCFVTLGTIEPRKNHLLLLHIWRDLAAEGRPAAAMPRLIVIGRRGWENEMVVDILERCPGLRDHVVECGDLSDGEAQALLAGARALLMPSFAEGLGVPLLEAAAWGVPAIVSDLPALREIAAPGTAFLSPIDGEGWRREILARASGA